MPIPTIATVSPATGTPTGGQLVEITGTNFRLPTAPAADVVPVPVAPPSVRVSFGGNVSTRVDVISATRLLVRVPKRTMPIGGDGETLGTEAVDLVVENIDDSGVLIPTETVTEADGYTYTRPGISYEHGPYGLTRVTRELVDLLRSEAHPNVMLETSVDYDPATGTAVIEGQSLPQVILSGPVVMFNSFFTDRGNILVDGINVNEGYRQRRHRVLDLDYEIIGVTKSLVELNNLIELLELVVDRNTTIQFELEYGSGDTIPLELRWITDPSYERQDLDGLMSDLRVFRGALQVRGYPVTSFPGVDQDAVEEVGYEVDVTTLEAPLQIGDNLPTTHGAPTRSPPDSDAT